MDNCSHCITKPANLNYALCLCTNTWHVLKAFRFFLYFHCCQTVTQSSRGGARRDHTLLKALVHALAAEHWENSHGLSRCCLCISSIMPHQKLNRSQYIELSQVPVYTCTQVYNGFWKAPPLWATRLSISGAAGSTAKGSAELLTCSSSSSSSLL